MKKVVLIIVFCLTANLSDAQNDLDVLLAAGVEDAQRFTSDYLAPGSNGLMYGMNANWFNTADVKPLGGFEISIIGNAVTIASENKSFLMNTQLYNNVAFVQGGNSQYVSSVLGENNPDVDVILTYDDPIFGQQTVQITLPNGIGDSSANLIPIAFIQGALGLSKGIELKARIVPKINTKDVDLSLYGAGLQFEFTKWLPADKVLPVALSGLVAYTHLDGSYNLTESSVISGENQQLESDVDTWLFQFIASTKLPVINFYGGIGYIIGKSDSDLLGTYRVSNGIVTSEDIVDPFSVSSEISGIRGTIGTKLKLSFFRLNAEYHLAEFNTFSVGLNFGFR